MNSGKEYSISEAKEIIKKNLQKNTYKVNFTGGDPIAQSTAVAELAKFVQSKKIPTYLESSCYDSSKFAQVIPYINFIKIEFKTPESGFVDSKHYSKLLENELECLRLAKKSKKTTYIKVVISSKTQLSQFKKLLKQIFKIISKTELAGFIIQPTYGISEPSLEQLFRFYDSVYDYDAQVRIIPQLHKFIGAP
jgi:pyruvate-formate lyase-activating enzyme